ncbi:MAG: glycoside hydrolase family 5 protein [Oscillospiraceae bacterium]|nr:glycoside hydrolase family 5 protein [Oscillospiraceae bacterium]
MRGVNLGGWLSQYNGKLKIGDAHFDSFITEKDIEQIADWGLDHIRLPVDYMIFESDDRPGYYDETALGYIDRCIDWCKKRGLNLIIDLHHAPGFSFHTLATNSLFTDEKMQQRMIDIWVNFAQRYINEGDNLSFELMNEIVEPDSTRWNALAAKIVAKIREVDKTRIILIGGNHYNAVSALKDIAIIPDDDYIVYNFHFYEPMLLTHQMASWNKMNMDYGLKPLYPSVFPGVGEFIAKHPEYSYLKEFDGLYVDIENLKKYLKPALEFRKNHPDKTLYCGEYGVIDVADPQSRRNWHRDFNDLMDEYNIGRAVWSYKFMNFTFVNRDGTAADSELIDIISGKK